MHSTPIAAAAASAIGQPLQGGFFAGTFMLGGELHALVVAPKAEGELAPAAWLTRYELVPGTESCVDGLANTLALAEAGGTHAQAALKLQIGGFTDWYLPARDEVELLYRNLKPTTDTNSASFRDGDNPSSVPAGYPYTEAAPVQTAAPAFQAGGAEAFEADWYWASTQFSRDYAWDQYFDDGTQYGSGKKFEARARAVRRFKVQPFSA